MGLHTRKVKFEEVNVITVSKYITYTENELDTWFSIPQLELVRQITSLLKRRQLQICEVRDVHLQQIHQI